MSRVVARLLWFCVATVYDWLKKSRATFLTNFLNQDPVVQKVVSAIYRINHYPADNTMDFVNTYPLDSELSGR